MRKRDETDRKGIGETLIIIIMKKINKCRYAVTAAVAAKQTTKFSRELPKGPASPFPFHVSS